MAACVQPILAVQQRRAHGIVASLDYFKPRKEDLLKDRASLAFATSRISISVLSAYVAQSALGLAY